MLRINGRQTLPLIYTQEVAKSELAKRCFGFTGAPLVSGHKTGLPILPVSEIKGWFAVQGGLMSAVEEV